MPEAPAAPVFSGTLVVGNIWVLTGTGVPGGFQFVPVPLGSVSLFTDLTGDGDGDVILLSPDMTLVLDGRTGRFLAMGADDNGDGTRDLWIFNLDSTMTRIDGRTGQTRVF